MEYGVSSAINFPLKMGGRVVRKEVQDVDQKPENDSDSESESETE